MCITRFLLIAFLFIAGNAVAITPEEVKAIALGETDARVEALGKAMLAADDTTTAFLQALSDDAVKVAGGKVLVVRDGKGFDPVTGADAAVSTDLEDVINNNRMRGEIDSALAALKLFSKDDKVRQAAVKQLQSDADETKLPLIEKALANEQNPDIKDQLSMVRAAALLNSADKSKRLDAAKLLATSGQANTKTMLLAQIAQEPDSEVKAALGAALRQVESALAYLWADGRDQHGPR